MNKLLRAFFLMAPICSFAQTATNVPPLADIDNPLDQVRIQLTLSPEQLPLWLAYIQSIDAYAVLHNRERPALPSEDEPAPRQIARMVDIAQNRLAALEDVERAGKTLYASLSVDQQKTANKMLLNTIPTFTGSLPGAASRDESRARGANRSRRSGGMGGGGF